MSIKLQGVFSISGQEEVNNAFDSTDLSYSISQRLRPINTDISLNSSDTLPQYYITLTGDINAFFDVSLSGGSGADDAWSCTNFTSGASVLDISSGTSTITLSDGTTSKNFTVGWVNTDVSGTIQIGEIDISTSDTNIVQSGITIDADSTTNKTYSYVLQVDMDSEGKLSFTTGAYVSAVDGTEQITISTAQDETLYQQQMYMSTVFNSAHTAFDGTLTTENGTDPLNGVSDYSATGTDVKSFTYDFADHNTNLTSALNTSLSGISGETLVSKLSVGVNEIAQSTTSGLTKWANEQGREGDTSTKLFNTGESVWIYNNLKNISNSSTATLDMRQYNYGENSVYTEVISRSFGIKLIQSSSGARDE